MTLIYMYTSLNEGALNEGDLLNLDIKGANKPAQTNKTNKKKICLNVKKKCTKKSQKPVTIICIVFCVVVKVSVA